MVAPKIRLHNPTYQARPDPSTFFQPKQISDLKGKSVVITDNGWPGWDPALPTLTEALSKRYRVSKTPIYTVARGGPLAPEVFEKATKEGDCVILGLAHGGPEVVGLLDHAILLAKAGLPTVSIVSEHNGYLWDKLAQSQKVNLPYVTVPLDPEKAIEHLPAEKAIEMMEAIIDDIVNALKNPPKPQIEEAVTEPFIEVPDSLDEIYDTMYRLDWSDGLPVIPPTEERVRKMLDHVHRDAEEVVGEMPPLRGMATMGNIAANAVMAGCLPEHMPLLMAQVRACGALGKNIYTTFTGGGAPAPMVIVNGPIRKELDINCTTGLMGPGRRSNATLGRALQFMLRNIGGAVLRIVEPDYVGQPGCYTLCFGENEEESPWEPLHVERGFSSQTSTVTVTTVSSIIVNATYAPEWKPTLTVLADSLTYFGNTALLRGRGMSWVFLFAEQAKRCAEAGLSKRDVKEFIWEKAQIPISEYPEEVQFFIKRLQGRGERRADLASPDDIMVMVVAGGPGYYTVTMGGGAGATVAIT